MVLTALQLRLSGSLYGRWGYLKYGYLEFQVALLDYQP